MKKTAAGLTFAIISAVLYLIALILALTTMERHYSGALEGAEAPFLISCVSVVLAIIGLITTKVDKEARGTSLSTVSSIVSILVILAGAVTAVAILFV